jgi:hypothetical protein
VNLAGPFQPLGVVGGIAYHHLTKSDKGWPFTFERTQIVFRNVVFEMLRRHIDFSSLFCFYKFFGSVLRRIGSGGIKIEFGGVSFSERSFY